MRTLFSGLIIAPMIIALPSQVSAQNVHTSLLYEQILENVALVPEGYSLDSFGIVRLLPGTSSRITLDVPANTDIEIMGDCDDDCFDLDLVAYNVANKVLAEDRLADYYPIVEFRSESDGRIEIELIMHDCDANYCYAGYSVFIGPES